MDIRGRLQELKEMHENGLITAAVYEQQQQTLLAAAAGASAAAAPTTGLDAILDPKKNLAALRRLVVLALVVLGGIWLVYSLAGRSTQDSISQFASQTGIGKQVIPWTDRADTAARKLIELNKVDLAASIQSITHPTGSNPTLSAFKVSKLVDRILVEMTVAWKGGLLRGDYSTTVVWEITEQSQIPAHVTFDSALTPVAPKNAALLSDYFRTKAYPTFVSDIGGS